MSEEVSREESFKALLGLVALQPERYSAEIIQKLESESVRQAGLNEVLLEACKLGDVITAKLAIKAGAEVDAKDNDGDTPAHKSAFNGHLNCLQLLVEHGAKVNTKDCDGDTPAHTAALYNYLECFKFLLQLGAKVNAKDNDGQTLAHWLALDGSLECLKLLFEHGVNVNTNAKDNDGQTPAHKAALHGHLECLKLLLERGAKVNAKDDNGWTPRRLAKSNLKHHIVEFIDEWIASHPQG